MFPRPGGPCLCGHSSSSCFLLWKLFDCSSTTAAPQQQQQPPAAAPAAGSSREQQAAAGSSRQQQAAAGISTQQQTQANAAVSATAAVKQLAASQQPASRNVSQAFCRRFQKGRAGLGKRIFWTLFVLQGHGVSSSGRAVSLCPSSDI